MIEGPLAGALARNRERLNARVRSLRLGGRALDQEDLSRHLNECVAPAVEAVVKIDDANADRVAADLFELMVELLAKDQFARTPRIAAAWRALLPVYARILRYDARRIAGALTNAIVTLSSVTGASRTASSTPSDPCERWISIMARIAEETADLEGFLDAGRVAAWRSGAAALRTRALERIPALGNAVLAGIFEVKASAANGEALAKTLQADRWLDPGRDHPSPRSPEARHVGRVGAFRGFGGEILAPPTVGKVGERLIASAADSKWEIHVDAFGAGLTKAPSSLTPSSGPVTSETRRLPEVVEATSCVSISGVTAVTLRYSHSVLLFATS